MFETPETMVERKHFLLPGEMVFADMPTCVKTVLGSCVAITMRAPRRGLAAVAHCLLPLAGAPAASLPRAEALKFVDSAIDVLLEVLAQNGAAREELEVKLFGGSDNMNSSGEPNGYGVGSSNADTALAVLAARGLDPVACDIGGRSGRVLEFETGTGEVLLKRLPIPGALKEAL